MKTRISYFYRIWTLRHAVVAIELRHVEAMPTMMRKIMMGTIECRQQQTEKPMMEVPGVRREWKHHGIVPMKRREMEAEAMPVE
jgi:hypothetical protein